MKKDWTKKCTCETFQQLEDCEHIGNKVLEEVGLGFGDKDCPDCKVNVGCSKHYIKDGDRHDRYKKEEFLPRVEINQIICGDCREVRR